MRLHECEHKFYELKRHKLNQLRDSIVIFDYIHQAFITHHSGELFSCVSL